MFDSADLQATANAQGTSVVQLAYEMTAPAPHWWLGRVAFAEQRWHEVAQAAGIAHDELRPMRGLFVPQFYEACAAYVRRHFGVMA